MRLMPLVVVVVGCRASPMDYPIGGGGGGGGGGISFPDATGSGSGSGSGSDLDAQACVLTDPRDLTSCAARLGLLVELGSASATTAVDGTFTIARPTGTNIVWSVSGNTVVQSVTSYAAQTKISVMDSTMFLQLEGDNGVQPVAGTGAVLMRIVRGGAPVVGETAIVTPDNTYGAFYDGATASSWTANGTGTFGTVYLPGVTSGTASVSLRTGSTIDATIGGIPITDGGVTFVEGVLP